MLDSGRLFFVVFVCHLTMEKLLKAAFVGRLGVEPPRIHNLIGLNSRVGLVIPADQRAIVNESDNMRVVTRCPDGRRALAAALTEQRASEMHDKTQEFSAWLRQEVT